MWLIIQRLNAANPMLVFVCWWKHISFLNKKELTIKRIYAVLTDSDSTNKKCHDADANSTNSKRTFVARAFQSGTFISSLMGVSKCFNEEKGWILDQDNATNENSLSQKKQINHHTRWTQQSHHFQRILSHFHFLIQIERVRNSKDLAKINVQLI